MEWMASSDCVEERLDSRRWGRGGAGLPAEREGTADQVPVAADRTIAAHHEVRPAQFLLHLLIALLDPVAQTVQAHDLRQVSRSMRRVGRSMRGWTREISGQIPGADRR